MAAPEISVFDQETHDCPYAAYRRLRDTAPVWQDPVTGMYWLTRYADIRAVELDTARFKNTISTQTVGEIGLSDDSDSAREHFEQQQRDDELARTYTEQGWVPGPALNARDDPDHIAVRRALFDSTFRSARGASFDGLVCSTVAEFIDRVADTGRCEWVGEFAAPMTLTVIMRHLGLPVADLQLVGDMTKAWIARAGLMAPAETDATAARLEVQFQQYTQAHIERVRKQPDGTLLSHIVHTPVPEWGRVLTDEELHGFITTDLMVGGGETTTGALAAGALMLATDRTLFETLAADSERHLDTFVEEVVRLESPVAGMFRQAAVDVELHGVTIPAGAVVHLRFASANRDERQFDNAERIDLARKNPRRHLAFGTGTHVCLGNTLARKEIYHTFKALVERFAAMHVDGDPASLTYRPNYIVRCLDELPLTLVPRNRAESK